MLVCVRVYIIQDFSLCVFLVLLCLLEESMVSFSFVQTVVSDVWRWQMSPIPPSPPSDSNLCSFSDKPRHLVVLAWDGGCTMGCCKLRAWSGPGTPHLMGNSLNSAHLGRQCRLGPLFFLATPASHRLCHLPLTQQPLYLAAAPEPFQPTLGPWPMQLSPYLPSCPTVHQARHIQTGPAFR